MNQRKEILTKAVGRWVFYILLMAFLQFAVLARAEEEPPLAPMSEFPDILNGERDVFPVDDLLVISTFKDPLIGRAQRRVDVGLTNDSAVSQLIGTTLHSNGLANYGSVNGPVLVGTGRFFLWDRDSAITFTLSDYKYGYTTVPLHLETTVLGRQSSGGLWEYYYTQVPMPAEKPRAVAVADWTGDGLDDIAFHAGSTESAGYTIIATASTASGPGLRFGLEHSTGPAFVDMQAGDLDGDGFPELIGLYQDMIGLHVRVHTVDPKTLEIQDPIGNELLVAGKLLAQKARLAVGKFDEKSDDAEIVVFYGGGGCGIGSPVHCGVYPMPLKVNITQTAEGEDQVFFVPQKPPRDIGMYFDDAAPSGWEALTGLEVATGKLNWFGGNSRDQIVVAAGMSSDSHYRGYGAVVLNFFTDADGAIDYSDAQVAASAFSNKAAPTTCVTGVQIGTFGAPTPEGEIVANAAVALLLPTLNTGNSQKTDCGMERWNTVSYTSLPVGIFEVNPANNFKMTSTSTTNFPSGGNVYGGNIFAPPRLAVGDIQGRSVVVGSPYIFVVSQQIQPHMVIGAPPMHLDYFTQTFAPERTECYASAAADWGSEPASIKYPPNENPPRAAAGCIQNVSAYPGHALGATACDYCAKFSISTDASRSGEQESTTSDTWAIDVGLSGSISFGQPKFRDPGNKGITFALQLGGQYMEQEVEKDRHEVLSKKTVSLDTSTGPEDYVLYTSQDLYFYMYPAIGKTDDDGYQLYLHFSVPQHTEQHEAEASALQWWQPPHEVGNIFSYPGNSAQLLADHPGATDRVTTATGEQDTGMLSWTSQTQVSSKVTWTQGLTDSQTAGSVDRLSGHVGGSVSGGGKVPTERFKQPTIKAEGKFDLQGSTAHHYLNTNKQSLSASEGFSITAAPFTLVPESAYSMGAHILGSETPDLEEGYWHQEVPLPDPKGEAGEDFVPDFRLDGPVQLVYTTDMLPNGSFTPGDLWNDVYSVAPDIALQHPKRYTYKQRASANALSDWWTFNPLYNNVDLKTVHSSEFLKMKGFFINPLDVPEGQGPQMTMAEEGEQLRLAARIYNYSLADLPAGGTVKVRFYAQKLKPYSEEWASGQPGDCVLIGEDSVTIGRFRSDVTATEATNRAMAETVFDTTGYAGQNLIFWVVTWAENAGGELVPELEQHGLTEKPPAACTDRSILDMPIEFYSNNVGFYDQPFFVTPQDWVSTPPLQAALSEEPFSIGEISVFPVIDTLPYAGQLWELEVPLSAGDQEATGVHVLHAGAGLGGRMMNTELIPFIEAGETYLDSLTFRPLRCGPHIALVSARPALQQRVHATREFDIPCRPEDVTAFFHDVITDESLAGQVEVNKNGQVLGRLAALQNALQTAEKLAARGATRGACQQYAQAAARVADADDGPAALLLESIIENVRQELGCRQ